jgi:hypothetical protein
MQTTVNSLKCKTGEISKCEKFLKTIKRTHREEVEVLGNPGSDP